MAKKSHCPQVAQHVSIYAFLCSNNFQICQDKVETVYSMFLPLPSPSPATVFGYQQPSVHPCLNKISVFVNCEYLLSAGTGWIDIAFMLH